MLVHSVTIGVPVSDLTRSAEWYRLALELDQPDLEPVEGVVEFRIGGVWLQLGRDATTPGAGPIVRLGVPDVAAERARLSSLGVPVGGLERVGGFLEYFDFADPDGNRLSLYTELEA